MIQDSRPDTFFPIKGGWKGSLRRALPIIIKK